MTTRWSSTSPPCSLNGPLAKKVLELRKPFNTLGFNGVKMAVIARDNDGYSAGTQMEFFLYR